MTLGGGDLTGTVTDARQGLLRGSDRRLQRCGTGRPTRTQHGGTGHRSVRDGGTDLPFHVGETVGVTGLFASRRASWRTRSAPGLARCWQPAPAGTGTGRVSAPDAVRREHRPRPRRRELRGGAVAPVPRRLLTLSASVSASLLSVSSLRIRLRTGLPTGVRTGTGSSRWSRDAAAVAQLRSAQLRLGVDSGPGRRGEPNPRRDRPPRFVS